jgi:translation initiation factor 3 subunit G
LATTLPPPQITKNKDGTETVVSIFINEDGKRVKRTQRIRRTIVKKKENPRVAERRQWAKIGPEAGKPAGPRPDTTTLGENIIFRPVVGFKSGQQQEKAPEEDKKAEALKKMQIKCRICSGDHFTTKCPFKDTMAPEGEAAGPPPDMDDRMGGAAEGGLGAGGSSYVPPHLRNKGAGGAGEKMGGRYGERDDLATLRVTNVSLLGTLRCLDMLLTSTRSQNSLRKPICGICSSGLAASLVSSSRRTERLDERKALRLYRMLTGQMRRGHVSGWMAMGSVT